MDLDEFIAQFAEQLDTTDAGSISADTEFKNLDDWTSMTALVLCPIWFVSVQALR